MFSRLKEDIATVRERDPAARSTLEILLSSKSIAGFFTNLELIRDSDQLRNARDTLKARIAELEKKRK